MKTPPETVTRCRRCGCKIAYEPLVIGSRDFGQLLANYCESCEDLQKREQAEQDADEREQRMISQIRAIIPPDLRDTRVDHPNFNRTLWAAVNKWTPGIDSEWLGLIGSAGQCKTRVLALKANKMIRQGSRVFWTDAVRFQTFAEDRNNRDARRASIAQEHLHECHAAAVLIIDDLGKNTWSAAMERHLFSVLDHRRNHRLPVLWSANCHPKEFAASISKHNQGPIIGRMIDRCLAIEI